LDDIKLDIFSTEYSNDIISSSDNAAVRSNEDDFLEGFYAFKPIIGTVNSVSEIIEETDNSDNDDSGNAVKAEMSDELTSEEEMNNELTSEEEMNNELTSEEEMSDELTSEEEMSDELTSEVEMSDELISEEEIEQQINLSSVLQEELFKILQEKAPRAEGQTLKVSYIQEDTGITNFTNKIQFSESILRIGTYCSE